MTAFLTFTGDDFEMAVPLGDGAVEPTAGGAVFDETARPERTAMSDFTGNELIRLDVPIFFDGWSEQRSIEPELWALIALCRGHDGSPPPDFVATGPMPFAGIRYTMGLPEFGDTDRRQGDGQIVRQELTGHLIQSQPPDALRPRKAIETLHNKPRTVTTRAGDTCVKIAARYLHDASRGKEVAKLNGIRDPRKKLPAGKKIKLPGK